MVILQNMFFCKKGGTMDDSRFDKMGIYDLRNYARTIGVHSPTKLKRDELIANIKAILQGLQEPEKQKISRGRPPKHKMDEDFMLDSIIPNNLFSTNDARYKPFYQSRLTRQYAQDMLFERTNVQNNVEFDGYFERVDENYGFVHKNGYMTSYSKENIVILKDMIEQFNLTNGDFVCGACKLISAKNIMLATNILSINENSPCNQITKTPFASLKVKYPSLSINFCKYNKSESAKLIDKISPIALGERVVVNANQQLPIDFYVSLLDSLLAKCQKVLFVSIDDVLEEVCQVEYKCPNAEFCIYDTDMTIGQFFQRIDTILQNYAHRLEIGQDVAVVFYNFANLQKNIKNFAILKDKLTIEEAQIYMQNKSKDFFKMARETESSSMTVVAFNVQDEQCLQIANCQIFGTYDVKQNKFELDTEKSFSNYSQTILSPKDYQALCDFKNALSQGKSPKEAKAILLADD